MNRPPTGGSRRLGTGFRPGTRGSGTPGGGGQSSVFSGTGVRVEDRLIVLIVLSYVVVVKIFLYFIG